MQLLLRDEELKDAVRIKDLRGRTALFKCIKNDEGVKWMQSLIDAGADVAIEDEGGWTPLIYACVNGSMEMVRLLVRNGADINHIPEDGWTALHTVVQNGLVEQTKFLLQEGAHVNLPTGDDHETPLHIAARTDHVEIVRELLNMHANTEWTTKNGNETALHIASRLGHVDIVRELLKEGADPTKEISKNRTALELATKYNSDEYRMIRVELLKKLKDGARDVGIAQLASSTNWNTLEPLLDGLHEQEHSDLKEQLTLTCLASDPDVFSHEKLCSMLAGKTDSRPDKHEKWTALHWAAYLGYSDLVLW
jgi:ankyrin repeat protein